MTRTETAWLILAEVANSKSCISTKNGVPQLRVKASLRPPKSVKNCECYKLQVNDDIHVEESRL